jgi:hypothetical protein
MNIERWMYFRDFYLQLWMETADYALSGVAPERHAVEARYGIP